MPEMTRQHLDLLKKNKDAWREARRLSAEADAMLGTAGQALQELLGTLQQEYLDLGVTMVVPLIKCDDIVGMTLYYNNGTDEDIYVPGKEPKDIF